MSEEKERKEILFPKPSDDDVIQNITAFLHSEEYENTYDAFIRERTAIVEQLEELSSDGDINPEQVSEIILRNDNAISTLTSILGMSQEEFYRVITLIRILDGTFESEWKIDRILSECKKDPAFRLKVARILTNGKDDEVLKRHIPRFSLNKLDKQKLLLNKDALIDGLIRQGLKGQYDARKGKIAEDAIQNTLDDLNVQYSSGEVDVPGIDRKMDFVIPNEKDPHVLIECGVFITTARELSEKGLVEMMLRRQVEEHYPRAVLVRVTDGIGWIARGGNALQNVIEASHYILTLNQLELLIPILRHHVPRQYFKTALTEYFTKK